MQQYLFKHFSEEGHHGFLENVSITLVGKTDPSNPLQRENYWRSILKTMVHGDWTLNVSQIAFCFILSTKFVQILIRTWFTKTILKPIINVPLFITIIAVNIFMTLLFLLLLSRRLCCCSSCHYYWSWFDRRCYCYHFCSIVVVIASLFCSF